MPTCLQRGLLLLLACGFCHTPGSAQTDFRAWRKAGPQAGKELDKVLDGISLPESPTPAQAEVWLTALCQIIGRGDPGNEIRSRENRFLLKLAAVGSPNEETLCRFSEALLTPKAAALQVFPPLGRGEWRLNRPNLDFLTEHLERVANDLAQADQKAIILKYHRPWFDLLPAIEEHGWLAAALPGMIETAAREPLPRGWLAAFADSATPEGQAALIAQCQLGSFDHHVLINLVDRPGSPGRDALTALWHTASTRAGDPARFGRIFGLACRAGVADLPAGLLEILQRPCPGWMKGNDLLLAQSTLTQIFAWHSACPADPAAARPWLAEHAAGLRFDPASGRYEIQ